MKISVTLRGPISRFAGSSLCFHATTDEELLLQIQSQNPALFHAMFLSNKKMNPFVKIFRNSEEIELSDLFLQRDEDNISITMMSIMSGG